MHTATSNRRPSKKLQTATDNAYVYETCVAYTEYHENVKLKLVMHLDTF